MIKSTSIILFFSLLSASTLFTQAAVINSAINTQSSNTVLQSISKILVADQQSPKTIEKVNKINNNRIKQVEYQKKEAEKAQIHRSAATQKYQKAIQKSASIEKQIDRQKRKIDNLEKDLSKSLRKGNITEINHEREKIKISKATIDLKELEKKRDVIHRSMIK
ncbi:hypothetical protein [Sphingobacterium rhinopitheci]|uniref:hypothetical protein n=1 Tax=Sphingobacterium rhinopitheci TaxID=2781960 RepID=UPI001F515CDD|nr:hypothetical protein [Sphingobacterium rhinopitheci]MCI0920968.1 hypothetical protein [Sphingobacterium rhinopitheci]